MVDEPSYIFHCFYEEAKVAQGHLEERSDEGGISRRAGNRKTGFRPVGRYPDDAPAGPLKQRTAGQ